MKMNPSAVPSHRDPPAWNSWIALRIKRPRRTSSYTTEGTLSQSDQPINQSVGIVDERTHRYANIMCGGVCCSSLQRRPIKSAELSTVTREQAGISTDAIEYVTSQKIHTNPRSTSNRTYRRTSVVQLPAQSQLRTTWQRMSLALQPGVYCL